MLGNIHTLVESNQLEKYYKLLTNFDFLAAKVQHSDFGVQALIEDYDLVEDNNETVKTLRLIQGALRLSAHILVKNANELAGQLSARLLYFDAPEIQNLLQQISEAKNTGLLSLTPSLSPPDGNLISTLSGHLDSVNAVAVTPDGKFVVSGSSDHTVKVWNLNTATEVLTFRGHTSSVNAVAVTPDGKKVVSGASDNTVRVWNLETGAEILTFNGHSLPIIAVTVTLDGQKVVSASIANINSIKVWHLETGKEELTLKGHGNLVKTIAITRYEVISGGDDGIIKVWSLKNGKLLFKAYGDPHIEDREPIYAIAATVDCSRMVTVCRNNYLTAWNREINQQIYQRKYFCIAFGRELNSHTAPIVDLALIPDRTRFISASLDKTLKVWDASGKELLNFTGHDDSIFAVITTPDCKKLISASRDKTLKVWNIDSVEKHIQDTNDISVNDVTITPDGKTAFFCLKNNIITAYDLENIESTQKLTTGKNKSVLHRVKEQFISSVELLFFILVFIVKCSLSFSLLFSSIGLIYSFSVNILGEKVGVKVFEIITYLVICGSSWKYFYFFLPERIRCLIRLISLRKLSSFFKESHTNIKSENLPRYTKYSDLKLDTQPGLREQKKQIIAIVATPRNHDLICINNIMWSSFFVRIWSLNQKNYIFDLRTPLQLFYLLLCLLMIIFSVLFFVFFWERIYGYFSSLSWKAIFLSGLSAIHLRLLYIVLLFEESPTTISITPDGKYLISGSSKGTINIWNLQNKKLLFILKDQKQKVTALAITPDGKYLISGSDDTTINIYVWNLETRKQLFTLMGHRDSVNTISVTPDGKHLISGSKDKTIKIWNLENREEIFTFTGHTDSINSVKITSDGQLVISASSDKTIQVWNFETRKVIAKFTGESEINCCAVAPDDVTIVAGEEAGNIHFLRLQDFQVSI